MKLSKIYSNFPNMFEPIIFNDGLNVILGEITQTKGKNNKKTTHNLGKSILCRLIDFCLLAGGKALFLHQHEDFNVFSFFLEIKLKPDLYLTIKRSVSRDTKISIKRHEHSKQDYIGISESDWDHFEIDIKKAKEIINSYLLWKIPKEYDYRNIIGYFLRNQNDYQDVFNLSKNKGKEAYWKPCLASMLGFDGDLIQSHYKQEELIEEKTSDQKSLEKFGEKSISSLNEKRGVLQSLQADVHKKEKDLNDFNFYQQDQDGIVELVSSINVKIKELNEECYYLNQKKYKIEQSLAKVSYRFNPNKAAQLFKDVGIFFEGQLKKNYEELIAFNKSITKERDAYLKKELEVLKQRLEMNEKELKEYNSQKQSKLKFIRNEDAFEKYKDYSADIEVIKKEISDLEYKISQLEQADKIGTEIKILGNEKNNIEIKIHNEVNNKPEDLRSLFSQIQDYFKQIIQGVLGKNANIIIDLNRNSHLVFRAKIINSKGKNTSEDDGHSYKKLMCIAFDLAILRAYLDKKFIHFAYHDGALESLDNRAKRNLLIIVREYSNKGIQSIITVNDSDLPDTVVNCFTKDEVILTLKDTGKRLFNMPPW